MALAAAAAMYDSAGVTLAAVAIAVVIPLVNVVSVVVLSAHGAGAAARGRDAMGQILRNPIILGIALNLSGVRLPAMGEEFLRLLGRAALPLGLLCVGAGLDLAALRREPERRTTLLEGRADQRPARAAGAAMAGASALKLLVLPGITGLICLALGVQGATLEIAVMFNGCPASAASYILTRQLGGDHRLMAGIITVQTLAAMATLPLLMFLV